MWAVSVLFKLVEVLFSECSRFLVHSVWFLVIAQAD